MIKRIVLVCLLIAGFIRLKTYLLSEDFQIYADQNKVEWSCSFNYYVSEIFLIFDNPERAMGFLDRIPKRCPKTEIEEKAIYRKGYCLLRLHRKNLAKIHYQNFIEKYPKSKRTKDAMEKIDVIKFSH